jgi:uncharacterized protein YdiU (UPF0061 family)
VAAWQAVGFVHGVLNTDNLAVSGDTLDYGPFGFMDVYDPDYVPNNSDAAGRYSYRQQPAVCEWNVRRLAHSLGPLLGGEQPTAEAEAAAVDAFWTEYRTEHRRRYRDKLGLLVVDEGAADDRLLSWLLDVMQATGADYTNVFRCLARIEWDPTEAACYRPPQVKAPSRRSSTRASTHRQTWTDTYTHTYTHTPTHTHTHTYAHTHTHTHTHTRTGPTSRHAERRALLVARGATAPALALQLLAPDSDASHSIRVFSRLNQAQERPAPHRPSSAQPPPLTRPLPPHKPTRPPTRHSVAAPMLPPRPPLPLTPAPMLPSPAVI